VIVVIPLVRGDSGSCIGIPLSVEEIVIVGFVPIPHL